VDTLRVRGGRLEGATVRGIAALIGGKRSTTYNALAALVASGVVTKLGSELVLTG
jgi:DNA-binding IclR family transcriptional regulator